MLVIWFLRNQCCLRDETKSIYQYATPWLAFAKQIKPVYTIRYIQHLAVLLLFLVRWGVMQGAHDTDVVHTTQARQLDVGWTSLDV